MNRLESLNMRPGIFCSMHLYVTILLKLLYINKLIKSDMHQSLGTGAQKSTRRKIDPTFAQPGVSITANIKRKELDKLEKTVNSLESLFKAVPEL